MEKIDYENLSTWLKDKKPGIYDIEIVNAPSEAFVGDAETFSPSELGLILSSAPEDVLLNLSISLPKETVDTVSCFNGFRYNMPINSIKMKSNYVEDASWMCYNCHNLQSADVDFKNMTMASGMFTDCEELKKVNITSKKIGIAPSMLKGCTKLKTVDLDNFEMTKDFPLRNLRSLLGGCTQLTTLDTSSLDSRVRLFRLG